MRTLFYALIFMLVNVQINIGASSISLIPNFIGFYLLRKGTDELREASDHFVRLNGYATPMMIYFLVIFFVDLLGLSHRLGGFAAILALISVGLTLYATWHLIAGIRDIEAQRAVDLNSASLRSTFIACAVTSVLIVVGPIFPPLAVAAMLINIIMSVIFLVQFHRTQELYEASVNESPS